MVTGARPRAIALALSSACGLLCACGAQDEAAAQGTPSQEGSTMKLQSTAFNAMGAIPRKYTCEGDDTAPPLAWSEVPAQAKTFALIVDDPDAPDPKAPKMTWVHWVLFDIPKGTSALPEGGKPLPEGAHEGLNDWKRTGYGGPCPPVGRHRYFFKLYALDTQLGLKSPTKAQLEAAMKGHILAHAELIGTYEKQQK
jgi:Raf kinase inhibitor-like YbhB/YbcL family protein